MWLRGRATGLLLALRTPEGPLAEVAKQGPAALELADGYTDVLNAARRKKKTNLSAEVQQSLLPPRLARIAGAEIACSVLASYEVGGDWIDYVDNRAATWLAVADAAGRGPTAPGLGASALAALRAARRSDAMLEQAAGAMHAAVVDMGGEDVFITAVIARWHAPSSTFSWISCENQSAVSTARSIQEAVVDASEAPMRDDATLLVLAIS